MEVVLKKTFMITAAALKELNALSSSHKSKLKVCVHLLSNIGCRLTAGLSTYNISAHILIKKVSHLKKFFIDSLGETWE